MKTFDTITLNQRTYALVPIEALAGVEDRIEDALDALVADAVKERMEQCDEEALPLALTRRIIAGESPVKVYREHRRLTRKALAQAAGITEHYVAMLEAGRRKGTVQVLRRIAQALDVEIEDLL